MSLMNVSPECPPEYRGKILVITNADHFRSMTDEELAEFLDQHGADTICDLLCGGGCNAIPTLTETAEERCRRIILEKLREPYKEKER